MDRCRRRYVTSYQLYIRQPGVLPAEAAIGFGVPPSGDFPPPNRLKAELRTGLPPHFAIRPQAIMHLAIYFNLRSDGFLGLFALAGNSLGLRHEDNWLHVRRPRVDLLQLSDE